MQFYIKKTGAVLEMDDRNRNKKWHALYTKSRNEKKVYQQLIGKGITCYLPLKKEWKQWSDRRKLVESPLINSYLFVKVNSKEYFEVLNTYGAVRYIFFEGRAAEIPEKQIQVLRQVVESNQLQFQLINTPLQKGDQVEITKGPLSGYCGEVFQEPSNRKILIRIDYIGNSLVVEIDKTWDVVRKSKVTAG
ncbi:MAG: UpxY family transcription antiterminator [Bacteroidales bacterium]